MNSLIKLAVVAAVAIVAVQWFGLTPERVAADAEDLFSGNAMERTKERLRSEAASMAPSAGAEAKDELHQELMAERKRLLEEKANTLERYGGQIAKGDIESVQRQVVENARLAGGDR